MRSKDISLDAGEPMVDCVEPIRLDFTNVMDAAVTGEHGLTANELEAWKPRVEGLLDAFRSRHSDRRPAFLDLPDREDLLRDVQALEPCLEAVSTFVVLGIGGTALGPRAIHEGIWGPHHAIRSGLPGGPARRLLFADNIDPESFSELLQTLEPASTLFYVVSKSGSTLETMAQLTVAWRHLREAQGEARIGRHFVFATADEPNFLRRTAQQFAVPVLTIPEEIGLRFSVLTPVGLFPALAGGSPPEVLLEGAADMRERALRTHVYENPAAMLALIHVLLDRLKGKSIAVMMPYSDRLRGFSDWFCQLWAESLGKSTTPSGEERAPVGQTPLRAVGTTDQHAQTQLFLEGPNDKLITLLAVEGFRADPVLGAPGLTEEGSDLAYLEGDRLSRVFEVERIATEMVLWNADRPTLVWRLPCVNAHVMGQLFMAYEVACALAGGLHNVDPFTQPGLADGKLLAFGALGRAGYERIGSEMEKYRRRSGARVVE